MAGFLLGLGAWKAVFVHNTVPFHILKKWLTKVGGAVFSRWSQKAARQLKNKNYYCNALQKEN